MAEEKKSSSIDSIIDEKSLEAPPLHDVPLVDLKAAALHDHVGEVFDDVRAIDLGQDGKERPIGECFEGNRAQSVLT